MSDGLDVRYQRDSNVVYREIAEERILVPIRKQVADMACIYVLNETGARIWELMDGQRSLAEIRDAQWASSIEQTADKIFSLWRPARTEPMGKMIETESGQRLEVTETLLLVRMLKQRMDRARFTWKMHFDPA